MNPIDNKFKNKREELSWLSGDPSDQLSQQELSGIRQNILTAISTQPAAAEVFDAGPGRSQKIIRYVVSILIGLSLVGGTAFASGSALPGDALYPVKRLTEKVQLGLTVSEEAKANLQAEFAQERLNELTQLAKSHKTPPPGANLGLSATGTTDVESTSTGSGGKGNDEIEIHAKQEAKIEVNNAVINLQRVKDKLSAKGNSHAAAEVGKNILNLQNNARLEDIDGSGAGDNNNDQSTGQGNRRDKNFLEFKATGTPPSLIQSTGSSTEFRVDLQKGEGSDDSSGRGSEDNLNIRIP